MNKQHKSDLHKAGIFAKYLKNEFGWVYTPVHPQKQYVPDVDVILKSEDGREDLLIQITDDIKYESTFGKEIDGKGTPFFDAGLFSESIERKEAKYRKQDCDFSNLILLVFGSTRPEYIQYDIDVSRHLASSFRGIYIISPKFTYSSFGERYAHHVQEEWTYPVKKAF